MRCSCSRIRVGSVGCHPPIPGIVGMEGIAAVGIPGSPAVGIPDSAPPSIIGDAPSLRDTWIWLKWSATCHSVLAMPSISLFAWSQALT